jgi:hypothetical protein
MQNEGACMNMAIERHGWLRKALTDRGLAAADAARAWGCHDSVLTRFIKTGEPKITAFRVSALVRLLDIPRPEILARLGERPVHFDELHDQPLSVVAAFAGALGMDVNEVLERLEQPKRRKTDRLTRAQKKNGETTPAAAGADDDDGYGGW